MIKCQACGAQNPESSQYCDQCGDSLIKYQAPEVVEPSEEQIESRDTIIQPPAEEVNDPVFQSAGITSIGIPPPAENLSKPLEESNPADSEELTKVSGKNDEDLTEISKRQNNTSEKINVDGKSPVKNNQQVHSKLIIERGQSIGLEFPLSNNEAQIGRWDADNGIFPDVDLDAYDPEAKVSRKHARILRKEGGQYLIEDLGSTNGTFVNRGRRLIPGNPNRLNDGDEIIVGKTFLRFQVID